ncbi:hypothetical protein HY490_00180 [Candidatus Woesearchaeota archaeon]|nr:hypothetical protein [Candidatus Woesearchaeota archaeon]
MLSPFIKKLMFARQFAMMDGKIEVLGRRQVMLPFELLSDLQNVDEQKTYSIIKQDINQTMEAFAKRIGSSPTGMFKNIEEIFECFGLGKPEIIVLDQTRKAAVIRFHDNPVQQVSAAVLPGALAGMFSFLFGKPVDCTFKKCPVKGGATCEFHIN